MESDGAMVKSVASAGRRVVVTGGDGFVGSALVARGRVGEACVVGVVRGESVPPGCIRGPSLDADADWGCILRRDDVLIHAAARVHVRVDGAPDPLAAFRADNVVGTVRLARQAALAGVRRFVFISSIKVNGDQTPPGERFTADMRPAPTDAYGISKAEAEVALAAIAAETSMEVVIVRPPLVYGPGVRANFHDLMRWVASGLPLPLGAIEHNRRSLVALDNLVDLLVTCVDHPAAASRIFLAADGEDLSTAELIRRLAAAMGRRAKLLAVPEWVLQAGARLMGKEDMLLRLCGNLQVDCAKTCEVLGWRPPISVDEGMRRAVAGYKA
ncbi:UDP-glucose 4-epimerase [Aromatoleum tolulyticum]|uniref:UDP-glucose 4-epimerase n=2 Tax=Aromatoleum tolulyticum TaxID=34027 RepID=A0A1N6UUI8_9RHOO|nr:UDP-glucose 4-epimerase [Aromatoleum tolulyticum]